MGQYVSFFHPQTFVKTIKTYVNCKLCNNYVFPMENICDKNCRICKSCLVIRSKLKKYPGCLIKGCTGKHLIPNLINNNEINNKINQYEKLDNTIRCNDNSININHNETSSINSYSIMSNQRNHLSKEDKYYGFNKKQGTNREDPNKNTYLSINNNNNLNNIKPVNQIKPTVFGSNKITNLPISNKSIDYNEDDKQNIIQHKMSKLDTIQEIDNNHLNKLSSNEQSINLNNLETPMKNVNKKLDFEEISPIKTQNKNENYNPDSYEKILKSPPQDQTLFSKTIDNGKQNNLSRSSFEFNTVKKSSRTEYVNCPKCYFTIELMENTKFIKCVSPFCKDVNIHFCKDCKNIVSLAEKDNHYYDKALLLCKKTSK